MAKPQTRFSCQQCGSVAPRWAGKCDECGAWNSIVEEAIEIAPSKGLGFHQGPLKGKKIDFVSLMGEQENLPRKMVGISEFDHVCGGGLVPGSVILIGGDPGIGKSTLLLQALCSLAQKNIPCAYISGEEAIAQVRMRASRLKLSEAPLKLAAATNIKDIISSISQDPVPEIVVIDSIQTMYLEHLDSAPGTVSQVRGCTQELIRIAKKQNITLFIVGHVTKEGTIAGPRVLEHMVDTVLYFEGDRGHQFRIMRAVKNRFGPTDEIGVFEMTELGLAEVKNPSALFLSDRQGDISGASVFAGMEGTRPVLVEIQALVAPSALGTPRRAVVGWDSQRLAMILAVLEARCGVSIGPYDIYLNVAGGLKINEPAADLAVAAALLSSLSGEPLHQNLVIFGEIGLSGEVRSVAHTDQRLKEAAKLGFTKAFIPRINTKKGISSEYGIEPIQFHRVDELLPLFEDVKKSA